MPRDYTPLVINPGLASSLHLVQRGQLEPEEACARLGRLLQAALELEFSTVPPYLSAAFSLGGDNRQVYQLILRVAKEEMLHMTVVANLMNAIGIAPDIYQAIPAYPFDLKVIEPPLHLELESFSIEQVERLFMQIETPEDPVNFPTAFADEEEPVETIGQFYEKIIKILANDTIPGLFDNAARNAYKQISVDPNFVAFAYKNDSDHHTYPLAPEFDFVIRDKETAIRHLEWIVAEGEGSAPYNPLSPEDIPGHFYRFESIIKGRYLVRDGSTELGYRYAGASLPFDETKVHLFVPNAKAADFAHEPSVKRQMDRFNSRYSEMVDKLAFAFNCPRPAVEANAKAAYIASIGDMRSMVSAASNIIGAADRKGVTAGIPFEYVPSAPPAAS
ncbi:hypothetical protein FMN63_11445 [Stappia sp. BW2]|uniref:ferritin-like domain-containing protein n=1 Tax=Stappia sp. BW2 TaxID=2592622 RepID=UPI0011DE7390|nr:ferritin-like protein [Stappia sp. BW2]TYC68290.1 hypothetical protein FMN63_11445 [Stappia sp. BW2]